MAESAASQKLDIVPVRKPGERTKCVIAIDFGTTFSGVGWALQGCDDDLEIVMEWPGRGNRTSQKAPTVISYYPGGIQWGYQVSDLKDAIRGIKLLLDKSKVIEYTPAVNSERLLNKEGKEPVECAGDYLKKLFSHAKSVLDKRQIGSLMETWDVQYIVTVPAVWSHKAKDLTLQAACLAGIPKSGLCLLSEPEAAAVYAIRAIQPNSIGKDDCFIVCDAGGGTVDLITYRVAHTEPMRLVEVTEGTGAMCGSVVLDYRFLNFIIEIVGKDNYERLTEEAKQVILSRWQDEIKTRYEGPETSEDYLEPGGFIPLPGVPDIPENDVEDGMFYMESKHIQDIFNPSMEKIESLISDQQKRATKAGHPPATIVLVGGFGSSTYLAKRIQSKFSEMKIMQPKDAWSAIIRGAIYRGLEGNQVENRKARCHYGVRHKSVFDPVLHKGQKTHWCKYREEYMVEDQMTWYIKKGDSISENEPIKVPFCRCVPMDCDFQFESNLRVCYEEEAPTTCNESVSKVCKLESDLSNIPKDLFQKCESSKGLEYYYVEFDLALTPFSASLMFELEFNCLPYGMIASCYNVLQ